MSKEPANELSPSLWGRLFGIDARSLALFRICLDLLLLVDLATRLSDFSTFYPNDGMFSIEDAKQFYYHNPAIWSLHYLHGSAVYQGTLFALAAIAAVCLLVGYWTRVATVASWVLLCSLCNRNPMICNYGDLLMRMLLFWSMFLPLGRVWSLDARPSEQRRGGREPVRLVSVGAACMLAQVCFVYWFTGLVKWNGDWLAGDAIFRAMELDYCVRPLGKSLLAYPDLLRLMTQGTLLLELAAPTLVWTPWRTAGARTVIVAAMIGFHIGIELCMVPGLLSYACMTAWLVFLPSEFWDRVLRLGGRADGEPVAAREEAYPRRAPARVLTSVACGLLIVYILLWNIVTLDGPRFQALMPEKVRWIGHAAVVSQKWTMFYVPSRTNSWYIAKAELRSGRVVDLLSGGEAFDERKVRDSWRRLPNYRWRFYFRRLGFEVNRVFYQSTVDYLFATWNEGHSADEQIAKLELFYYEELKGDGFTREDFARRLLASAEDESADGDRFIRQMEALEKGGFNLP